MTRLSRVASLPGLITLLVAGAVQAHGPLNDSRSGSAALPGVEQAAILATNSVLLKQGSHIVGDVVVNAASAGPTLEAGAELAVDREARVEGNASADSVSLDRNASVTGTVSYNQLAKDSRATTGPLISPLPLPVFALLPAFHATAPRPEAPDVFVGPAEVRELAPGDYGHIVVADLGTAVFRGGIYSVRSLRAAASSGTCAFPCRSFAFRAPTEVRIAERVDTGVRAFLGPETGSGAAASDLILYVGGVDGDDGSLGSLPRAATFGRETRLAATVYAPRGTVVLERSSSATGALFARDVQLDQNASATADSFFANHPPTAYPQNVFTRGAAPLVITLTGSDPDGDDLSFAILSGPTQGALGPVAENPADSRSATVTYTPATAGDREDSFLFEVRDPLGAAGMATVRINPPDVPETPPPPPPDTVVARDGADDTRQDVPVILTLQGDAPAGVELTFAIVPGSGPAPGSLGTLTQGTGTPRRSATVVYTPASGFTGTDGFSFEVCGEVAGMEACDRGEVTITVSPPPVEPGELAPDQSVTLPQDRAIQITLGAAAVTGAAASLSREIVLIARPAAFLDGAEIAGNVADADADGQGDNHNILPGPSPVFVSAGVGQSGGAGSNGTARIHIEWNISDLAGIGTIDSAHVILHTHRGTVDSLPTAFFAVTGGNGTLEDADFASVGEPIRGAVMPVPPLSEMPLGADGTFSFDVLAQLRAALDAQAGFLSIQGRVDETLAGPARGLETRSTATDNLAAFLEPQLSITTPGVTPPLVFEVLSLPVHGLLRDSLGAAITAVPATLAGAKVSYTPDPGFIGPDSFQFQVTSGTLIDIGLISITVVPGNCAIDPSFCDNGR